MPEGPEVATVVDELNEIMAGSTIISIKTNLKSRYHNKETWNPPKTPFDITKISCKGKNIFFHLSNAGQYKYMYNHLLMTGKWLLDKGNASGIEFTFKQKDEIKKIYFDDIRKFGPILWMTKEQYDTKIKTIGPDLLTGEVTLDIWSQKITNKRIKNKMICDFLMDQKRVAGIGNYLKSEILYRAKIRPDRKLCDLIKTEIEFLYKVALDTIQESYKKRGLTIRDYLTPKGKKGEFNILVYNKEGKLDENGYIIVREIFKDKRSTYWVKEIQK